MNAARLNFFALCLLIYAVKLSSCKYKIGIVGAGTGGACCAHYLNILMKERKEEVEIHLYDKDEVGGRLKTTFIEDNEYETVTSRLIGTSKFMAQFKMLLKERAGSDSYGTVGLFDGEKFVYTSCSEEGYITRTAKVFYHFGLSLGALHVFASTNLNEFEKSIYEKLDDGYSFETPNDLFGSIKKNFSIYFNISTEEGFRRFVKINKEAIRDAVGVNLRSLYGETTRAHMLAGLFAINGLPHDTFSIKGGNKRIPKLCLLTSDAELRHQVVEEVIKLDNGMYRIRYSELESEDYDVVILAVPMASNLRSVERLVGFADNMEWVYGGEYYRMMVTVLKGDPSPWYFNTHKSNIDKYSAVTMVYDNPIHSATMMHPIVHNETYEASKKKLWKVSSESGARAAIEISRMFENRTVLHQEIQRYPDHTRINRDSRFVLADRLFHINAIEWASANLDTHLIGAKNVANLAAKALRQLKARSFLEDEKIHADKGKPEKKIPDREEL